MTPEEKAEEVKRISAALAAFFEPNEHKWKPAVVSGSRAMALCYVDARVIQDRLDDTVGSLNWKDAYEVLPCGSVVCTLSIRICDEWVSKVDVGSQSEQPDDGDKMKAAFSDALKRAAVKFGIGRYLYRLPSQWVDYDATKRKFTATPRLPDFVTDPSSAAGASSTTPGGRKTAPTESPLLAQYRAGLEKAATMGADQLAASWKVMPPEAQKACLALKESLKAKAAEVDRASPA